MKRFFLGPLLDFFDALPRVMPPAPWQGLIAAIAGLGVTWWLYVPVHEILHVAGCVATGGTVDRLEISPEYGAALLAKVFPFVAVGSDYAGQLVGFDTGGNDLIYLATVYAPYLLTLLPGVPLLRRLARHGRAGLVSSALLGASVPVAFAPFTNLLGDFYELGSIPVSRLAGALTGGTDPARWRSDDLIKLCRTLFGGEWRAADPFVLLGGMLLGTLCALGTYRLGVLLYDRVLDRQRRARSA
jgi:hypothetical protein